MARPTSVAIALAVSLIASIGLPTGLVAATASTPATAVPKMPTPAMTTAQRVSAAAAAQVGSAATPTVEVPPGGFHGKKVVSELLQRRTPASRTYATPQGTLVTLYYPAPIEYQDASGWHLVDAGLSATGGGGWHNAGDAATVSLPSSLAAGPVSIQTPTSTVSFSVDGATAAPGALAANTVTYAKALPGVDVSYRSRSGSLKETLTLGSPTAQRQFAFTATATGGVSLQPNAGGGLAVVDVAGKIIDVLAAPTMVDAAGATSNAVVLAASQVAGAWHLTLTPDPAWLNAPGRAWPVAVDPSVTFAGSPEIDTYISSASPTTSFSAATTFVIGHLASTGENDRGLMQFPDLGGSRLPDVNVLDAQLTMTQKTHSSANTTSISLYSGLKPWTASATWNKYDGTNSWSTAGGGSGTDYVATAADTQSGGTITGDEDWNFHPRAAVQNWFNFSTTTTATGGFFLVANQAVDNQLTFYSWDDSAHPLSQPYLYVEYTASVGGASSQTYISHKIDDAEKLSVNANGNLVIAANDYSVSGVGLSFALPRVYNSRTTPVGETGDLGKWWDMATGPDVGLYYYNDVGTDRGVNFTGPNGTDYLFTPLAGKCPQYPNDAARKYYTNSQGANADLCYSPTGDSFTLIYHASQEALTFNSKIPGSAQNYQLVSDTDRNANTISYGYDVNGVWTGATDSVGRTFTVTHNASGTIASVAETNFLGGTNATTHRSVSYGYDSTGAYLTSFTDETGQVTSYHYSTGADILIDKLTDPVGHQITFTYDTWQRVTSMTYVTNNATGAGATTTFTYAPNLLLNLQGDFETALLANTGWVVGTNSTLHTTTNGHLDGARALEATAGGTTMNFSTRTGTSGIPVTAGQQYAAKIHVEAVTTGSTATTLLRWYNAAGTLLSSSAGAPVSEVSTSWTTLGVVAAAPAGAAFADIQASYTGVSTSSIHWVDDAGFNVWPGDGVTPFPGWVEGLPNYLPASCSGLNATEVTDPNNNPTLYCYGVGDTVGLVVDALGHARQSKYNADIQPTALTDALSSVTTLQYDNNNNLTSLVAPASASSGATAAQTTIGYSTPNPNGSCMSNCSTGYQYLPSAVADPQSACQANAYDAIGNMTDAWSNQTGSTCSTGSGFHYVNKYQGDSGVTTCTNGLSTTNQGVLCSTTDANANTILNAYTFAGSAPKSLQSLTVTQPGGSCTPTHNMCQTATFDSDMRVSTTVAATPGSTSTDTKTTYCYDNDNRITKLFFTATSTNSSCTTGTPDVAYTWDIDGNLTQRVDSTGTTTFGYDDLGRVVTKNTGTNVCTSVVNGVTLNGGVCFGYDAASNLTSFVDFSGTTVYGYDTANEVTSLVEPGGTSGCVIGTTKTLCTAFAYDNAGRRTNTQYPGGATLAVTHDNAGNGLTVVGKNAGVTATLSSYTYCYRDLVSGACPTSGTITDRAKVQQVIKGPDSIQSASTTDYTYDASGRLCRAMSTAATTCPTTPPASGNAYGYDAAGNRQWSVIGAATSYYGYDADNRICWSKVTTTPGSGCSPPSGSTTYSFDNAGNLSSSAAPVSTFTYNTLGQATAITDNSVAMTAMSYADVGQSERVASTISGTTTNYLNSPLGLDKSTTGGTSTYVVRDPGGTPIGLKIGTSHWYYLLDGLGSVVGVISGDGSTLTDKYVYDEFGRTTSSTVGTAQPLGFVAGIADPTGLVKFGTRYYDPSLGRWTQQDPITGSIGNPLSLYRYLYAGEDPVNATDPTGLWSWTAFAQATVGGGLAGGAGGCVTGAVVTIWSGPGALAGCGIGAAGGAAGGLITGAIAYAWSQWTW